jgi:hypothetical protein
MAFGSFYEFDLIINLESIVGAYSDDRQFYWQTQENEKLGDVSIRFERAERFAEAILKNTEKLIPEKEIDEELSVFQDEFQKYLSRWERLAKMTVDEFKDISKLPTQEEREAAIREINKGIPEDPDCKESSLHIIWERFVIDMSWDAIGKIREGALRIFKLYELMLKSSPSEATQKFLSRLTRCYVWGFDPECIIMCRAVIDAAFKDRIPNKICKKYFVENDSYDFTLSNRIVAAYKEGIIGKEIRVKAFDVKEQGDDAVHYKPDITKDVWETICLTLDVLKKIT